MAIALVVWEPHLHCGIATASCGHPVEVSAEATDEEYSRLFSETKARKCKACTSAHYIGLAEQASTVSDLIEQVGKRPDGLSIIRFSPRRHAH